MVPTPDDDVPTVSGPRPDILEAARSAHAKVSPPDEEDDDEQTDDNLTTAIPRRASMPLAIPGKVQIRELEDLDEETEVRSVPAETAMVPTLTRPPTSPRSPAEDEPITTVASSPVPDMIRISPKSLMPVTLASPVTLAPATEQDDASQDDPPTRPGNLPPVDDEPFDTDESVTSRTLALRPTGPDYDDDSVTRDAPPPPMLAPADETEGTTKKRSRPPIVVVDRASARERLPADEEGESITTQAPALAKTVLAGGEDDDDDGEELTLDDDDGPENRTAVMASAPLLGNVTPSTLKYGTLQGIAPSSPPGARRASTTPMNTPMNPIGSSRAAAARNEPVRSGSDSGLRVSRPEPQSGERASLGALGVPETLPPPQDHQHFAHAPTEHAFPAIVSAPMMMPNQSALSTVHVPAVDGRGPRYGIIVAVVGAISLLFPLTLYFALRQPAAEPGRDLNSVSSGHPTRLDDTVGSRPNKDKATTGPVGSNRRR